MGRSDMPHFQRRSEMNDAAARWLNLSIGRAIFVAAYETASTVMLTFEDH